MIRIERDDDSADFYDGTADGTLLLRRCVHCGQVSAPAVTQCPHCDSTELDWAPAAGTGTLISWAIPRDRAGAVLAIAGLVEMAEGPWLRARIIDAEPDRLTAGLPLTLRWQRSGDDDQPGEIIPIFTPAQEASTR